MPNGSFQASCADPNTLPYLTGVPHISLGCYGCRKSKGLAAEVMLLGFKADMLEHIVKVLEELKKDPTPSCRGKRLPHPPPVESGHHVEIGGTL